MKPIERNGLYVCAECGEVVGIPDTNIFDNFCRNCGEPTADMGKKRGNGKGSIFWDSRKRLFRGQVTIGFDERGKQVRKSASAKTRKELEAKIDKIKVKYIGDNDDE